ncbi:MAG: aspartate-semialdehyde dehydrogenase [Flavobacteriales bacterium]|nr:aspartate-semialdehyde dehydrogenase [Flavobacteriales bacterium]
MKVAVVGATGLVGSKMLQVLEERNFPVSQLIPAASEASVGKSVFFKGKSWEVCSISDAVAATPDIALFSAGGGVSLEWAPRFAQQGTYVIDNSSTWRMDPNIPLVVPEINADSIRPEHHIIANPNCSTIQLVMALNPLHKKLGIQRLVISTYQSISGTGVKAVNQLENERNGQEGPMAYPYPIDRNCIPHCDVFMENGYTKEEMKLVNETRKILNDNSIAITATAVRIPVAGGHSESVNVKFNSSFTLSGIRQMLSQAPGVVLQDNPDTNLYPMPRFAHDKDDVFVGRLRIDESQPDSLNMWIVSDNLRKGAATNAVQIAEFVASKILVES